MEKIAHYHTDPHAFSLTTPTREHIMHLLDQLPSLDEVLQRQSRPPVCLYNYYIVLRDRLQMETLLDFWLDVQQAEILYRRYMKYQSKKQQQRQQNKKKSTSSSSAATATNQSPIESISLTSLSSQSDILTHMLLLQSRQERSPSPTANNSKSTTSFSSSTSTTGPRHQPSQTEMVDINERIYFRYIVPHAEKELIQLPPVLRDRIIKLFNQLSPDTTLDDPKVFQHAKRYVHILLQSSFTLFIRYRVFMNLTLPQQIIRLAAGLFSLLIGFSLEFTLIFLNIMPWTVRLWGIIPITFGIYFLCSSISGLDPIWVLCFNISETTTFKFNAIKQTKVRHILRTRSITLLFIMLASIILILVIFCVLPGNRL